MFKMSADKTATVLGYAIGAAQAAQVALGQIPPGTSMHQQDWIGLGMAVLWAVLGKVTNKGQQ